jgi:hypothetical protein
LNSAGVSWKGWWGRARQHRELGAGDALGHDPAKARRGRDVELPGHHQLGQAVQGVVGHEGVQLPLEGLHGLGVRGGQRLGDEPLDGPVGMGLWGVDPQEKASRAARSLGATSTSQCQNPAMARR